MSSKTISKSNNPVDWKIEQEKCYKIWRSLGTDCGVCISSCPVGQEITIDEISRMSHEEMDGFLINYGDKVGARKYNRELPL